MLTGENGTLTRTQDTKGTNAYASAVEQVKLAFMAVKTEIMTQKVSNSSYDATKEAGKLAKLVKQDLSGSEWTSIKVVNGATETDVESVTDDTEGNEIKIIYTNSSLRAGMVEKNKPRKDGYIEFSIELLEQDATLSIDEGRLIVKDSTGEKINLANIASYYGHDVTYNGKTYQLFYVDTAGKYSNGEPRIWLQLKDFVIGLQLSSHYETTGIATAGSILWQVNPDLDIKYGETIRGKAENSLSNNIKGVAYLCNPERWNSTYVVESDIAKGAYAIGGVSAEMYCDSYNQARGKTSMDVDYFYAKAYNENNTYGYRYKPAHVDASPNEEEFGFYSDSTKYPISGTINNKIYRSSGWQWLASPLSFNTDSVCGVYYRLAYQSRINAYLFSSSRSFFTSRYPNSAYKLSEFVTN